MIQIGFPLLEKKNVVKDFEVRKLKTKPKKEGGGELGREVKWTCLLSLLVPFAD